MKKRLKILIRISGIIIFGLVCFLVYLKLGLCPYGYILDRDIHECNDCMITKKQYFQGKKIRYNSTCEAIEKKCYLCIEDVGDLFLIPNNILFKIN